MESLSLGKNCLFFSTVSIRGLTGTYGNPLLPQWLLLPLLTSAGSVVPSWVLKSYVGLDAVRGLDCFPRTVERLQRLTCRWRRICNYSSSFRTPKQAVTSCSARAARLAGLKKISLEFSFKRASFINTLKWTCTPSPPPPSPHKRKNSRFTFYSSLTACLGSYIQYCWGSYDKHRP